MTTVAAVADGTSVWMAADTATNVYERPMLATARKVRQLHTAQAEPFLLGFCGAGGLAQWIPAKLKVERLPNSAEDADEWAAAIAWAVSELARDAGLTEGGQMDGSLLLGAVGRLWTLSNFQAIPHHDGLAAVGSGEGPAMGVLDALQGQLSGEALVCRAVELACRRDRFSEPPITCLAVTSEGVGRG